MSTTTAIDLITFSLFSDHPHHIHAAGCADVGKSRRNRHADVYRMEVTSLQALIEDDYQHQIAEGSSADDPDAWEGYADQYRIFPCAKRLPISEGE